MSAVNLARAGRLGVDFGTTHTVAAVENPAGVVTPLLFDASPLLLSAVYADPAGGLLTGRDAERGALHDPSRFEPNPKLRVDEGRILLGDAEFDIEELIAASLRRVAGEATRQLGAQPAATVLTHPAAWAARRRDVLARAAQRAGLDPVTLVPEPVAAAAHYVEVAGRPGSVLAVYDLGGGTFDVTVVRRDGTGWVPVAGAGLDDVGGIDLDESIMDHIGRTAAAAEPRQWRRLRSPTDLPGRRVLRSFRDDVRGAKEQLSRTPSAVVRVPGLEVEAYLSREEFEAAALPWLTRTVDLVARVLDRAGMRPDVLLLVGGSSRIPLVATLLHRRFGIAPTLVEQPELAVALGCLRVSDVDTAAVSDSWPTLSAEEIPPPQPAEQPAEEPAEQPARQPAEQPAPLRPPRRRPAVMAGLAALLVIVLIAVWQNAGGDGNSPFDLDIPSTGDSAGEAQSVAINKTAWYGGFRVAFETASFTPGERNRLTVAFKVQNLHRRDRGLNSGYLPMSVTVDGRTVGGDILGSTITVGAGSTVAATYYFDQPEPVRDLASGSLLLGDDDALKATVPIGPTGDLVALQPVPVLTDATVTVPDYRFRKLSCELRGDDSDGREQVRAGNIAIACVFDVTFVGSESDNGMYQENFRLIMPDGDLRAPTNGPSATTPRQRELPGLQVDFVVPWPAPGRYVLRVISISRIGGRVLGSADVPLATPSA